MITTKQRSKLKALANALRPSVTVGKEELTENILNEIATALIPLRVGSKVAFVAKLHAVCKGHVPRSMRKTRLRARIMRRQSLRGVQKKRQGKYRTYRILTP